MNILTVKSNPTLIKAMAICCKPLSDSYKKGVVVLEDVDGMLVARIMVRANSSNIGIRPEYCPFCGDPIVIQEHKEEPDASV